jgi:hypothetical protein
LIRIFKHNITKLEIFWLLHSFFLKFVT